MRKNLIFRELDRLVNDENGFAMEYIIITLLVGASVVGLVMVFSGNLRNMLGNINNTLTATSVEQVEAVAKDDEDLNEYLKQQNAIAIRAGNKLGGDFGQTGGDSGNGEGAAGDKSASQETYPVKDAPINTLLPVRDDVIIRDVIKPVSPPKLQQPISLPKGQPVAPKTGVAGSIG